MLQGACMIIKQRKGLTPWHLQGKWDDQNVMERHRLTRKKVQNRAWSEHAGVLVL
jgi:hypothetical protein